MREYPFDEIVPKDMHKPFIARTHQTVLDFLGSNHSLALKPWYVGRYFIGPIQRFATYREALDFALSLGWKAK